MRGDRVGAERGEAAGQDPVDAPVRRAGEIVEGGVRAGVLRRAQARVGQVAA